MIKRNILFGAVIGAAMTALAATASLAQQAPDGAGLFDVIVVMNEATAPGGHGANQSAAATFARGLGINPRHAYGTALFGFSASVPQAVMDALENNPRVDYVELDRIAFASAPPHCDNPANANHPSCNGGGEDDPPPSGQVTPWGIARTGADTSSNTGALIDVYVLDTGIDIGHPDLTNVGLRVDCTGNGGCVTDPGEADDKNGHGTHVAGTIGADDNDIGVVGMAPGVNLHAIQVLGNSGRGSYSGIIAGIDLVAGLGGHPSVINMSLGGSGEKKVGNNCTSGGFSGSGDSFHTAICNASIAGVVFVVAAGNSGDDASNHVPAAYHDTVITVSATDINDNFPLFSNYGDAVAIAAPGVSVLSTWKGGGTKAISGTSMASPHVAGAVALWLATDADDTNSGTPSTGFNAFLDARSALVGSGESTVGWGEPASKSHPEPFLDAEFL